MQLPFFYEATLTDADIMFVLSEVSQKHAIQVLRMKVDSALHLTNGKGLLCRAIITVADKKQCIVQIQSVQFFEAPQIQVSIGISLLKNTNRLEWFLEKATELGVNQIFLLHCSRTEKQHFRLDRLQGILIAAMLQSQQTWLPILHEPKAFETVIETATEPIKLIAHCENTTKTPITAITIQENVLLLIGPEGDFTTGEIQAASNKNFTSISLGNTRLRTETAGVVAATMLMLK